MRVSKKQLLALLAKKLWSSSSAQFMPTCLVLKSLGINNFMEFEFMDSPLGKTLIYVLELLYVLGALNDQGGMTKLGWRMTEFPIHPVLSKAIIESEKYVCTDEVCSLPLSEWNCMV